MVTINDNTASFQYNEQNLFQSIVDKSLYAVKYIAETDSIDDNVLTYSLSHDEKDYITSNISVAISELKRLISENTFFSTLTPEPEISGEIGFSISIKYCNQTADINHDKTLIMDSFAEIYIVNYVLAQWAELINIKNLTNNFEVKAAHSLDGFTSLLSQFTTLPETKSYEII